MKPAIYYDQVVKEATNTLLAAPLLHQIADLPSAKLHYLFSQIYHFVDLFPGFLGILLWQTNDERIRFAITENLVDECGGIEKIAKRDYSAMHSKMLRTFLQSINGAGISPAEKNTHTKILINNFNKLFINSTPIETIGAMASMESLSTEWFSLVYQQLLSRNEFSEQSLYFFELHTRLDEEHGNILKETLLPLLVDSESYILLRNGAMSAAAIWKNFYEALAEELQNNPLPC